MGDAVSMTGFGEGRSNEVLVQIAVVNHKTVAVAVRGDGNDLALEEELRGMVRSRLVRGSATVHVRLPGASRTGIDAVAVAALWRQLAAVAVEVGAPVPGIEHVALLLPRGEAQVVPREDILQATAAALTAVEAARKREGAALVVAMRAQAAALRALAIRMRERAAERLPAWRESLLARVRDALAGQAAVTPELLIREITIHAERIDVTEEQVRLAVHLDELDRLLTAGDAIGRSLDFLLQEIHREINTTGAKANDAPLAALVMSAKSLADQLKEQAANLQ